MKLLTNKKILVTGGSRGLGLSMIKEFAREGATVSFTYSQDETAANLALAELKQISNLDHCCFKVSVLDNGQMRSLAKDLVTRWGEIDILVNNAGVSQALPIPLMQEEDWDYVLDTNSKGVFIASKSFLPHMIKKRKGHILNIGSLAGEKMIEAPTHYCSSKASVSAFTRALSKEVGRFKVRVNCLAPGLLEDGVARNLPDYKLEDYIEHIALKRVGTLDEIARFAAFMVSDYSTFLQGSTISADGGY